MNSRSGDSDLLLLFVKQVPVPVFLYLQLFRIFFTQKCFFPKVLCIFALASTHDGYEVH